MVDLSEGWQKRELILMQFECILITFEFLYAWTKIHSYIVKKTKDSKNVLNFNLSQIYI